MGACCRSPESRSLRRRIPGRHLGAERLILNQILEQTFKERENEVSQLNRLGCLLKARRSELTASRLFLRRTVISIALSHPGSNDLLTTIAGSSSGSNLELATEN